MRLLWELIRKDLRLFVSDKRALIISFAIPLAIASFITMLFASMGGVDTPATKVAVLLVDNDASTFSKAFAADLAHGTSVAPTLVAESYAREQVKSGKADIAIVVPKGFGEKGIAALMNGGANGPELRFLYDPSKSIEMQAVQGSIIPAAMKALAKDLPGGPQQMPFTTAAEPISQGSKWSGSAHAFAGMAMQGLLFWVIDASMTMIRERRMGLWRRLRAAPVSPLMLLLGRWLSSAIRGLMILGVVFGFGSLLFHFQLTGSWLGFALLCACSALMTSAFGLFVAALGRNEQQSRGMVVFVVLAMSMLGGAWFPSFLMPEWIQTISLAIPIRWSIDGFDSMLWRGEGLTAALAPCAALMGFTIAFFAIAFFRFRWEPES